jgi:uncharacterized protein (TIGR03118 family)
MLRFPPSRWASGLRCARRPSKTRLHLEYLEDRCTPSTAFAETDLVSNIAGRAQFTDPNLVNPWGMSYAPSGEYWISDNGAGKTTLYDGQGNVSSLVVGVPPPSGSPAGTVGTPTGTVYNSTGGFGGGFFLFASEDGTISSWTGGSNTIVEVDNSAQPSSVDGAVYKGLAIGTNSANQPLLYAANFRAGTIDVFDSTFHATTVSGGFTDPNIPSGYAPFNIENLGGQLYVTYALQDAAKADQVSGAGHGFVDVFNTDGVLQSQLVAGGVLNSPWGVAIAPSNYGTFSNDLLVGNFGDGHINAFNPNSGASVGQLVDPNGNAITISGLWGLSFGNGGSAGSTGTLYFTAGLNDEADGLYGSLTETAGKTTTTTAIAAAPGTSKFGQSVTLTATVAPTSGTGTPTGSVTFEDGGVVIGMGNLQDNGGVEQAVLKVSNLSVGSHTLNAFYGGDSTFASSDSTAAPASVTVQPADTTTSMTASTNTEDVGQTITLTATVAAVAPGTGNPTGTVTFHNGAAVLGMATLGVDGNTGLDTATVQVNNLPVGKDNLYATYAGDGNYNISDSSAAPITVTVNPAITLPGSGLPADTVGVAYNQTLTATGGTGDITLTVTALVGPTNGLLIPPSATNALTIGGTPTGSGTVTFTLTAKDTVGGTTQQNYSFTINPAVSFTPATLPDGTIGVVYNSTISALGGTGDVQLAVSGVTGSIPGLSIPGSSTNTLNINGTPTATGTVTFTLTGTDTLGATHAQQYSITVDELNLTPGSGALPSGSAGTLYNQSISAQGGIGDVTLTVTNLTGTIAGLNIPAGGTNSLTIDGTPTGTGTISFTVNAADTANHSTSATYSLTIGAGGPAAATFTTGSQTITAGEASGTMTVELLDSDGNIAVAGSGGVTFTLSSDSLAGIFLDTSGQPLTGDQVTVPAGQSTASFEYEDVIAGHPTVKASAGYFTTQRESVVAAEAAGLTLQVASQGIAGGGIPVGVTAVDLFGNTATTYSGSAALQLVNAANGKQLSTGYVSLSQGVGNYTPIVLGTPGTDMLTAVSLGTLDPASKAIQVIAAPTFAMTLAPASAGNFGSGQQFKVVITARAGGQTEIAYTGPIHLTSSDPQAILPSNPTITSGGTASFLVTLKTAGKQTISANDITLATARGTSNAITVTSNLPLTLDHFIVSGMPGTDVVGVNHPITITAVNAAGQIVTGYTGPIQLHSADPNPINVTFAASEHGVKHLTLALNTLGVQSLTADDSSHHAGSESNINVVSRATRLGSMLSATSTTAGTPITLTVTAFAGATLTDAQFSDQLSVTTSDPQATVIPQPASGGVQTFVITLRTAGTQTITVTDNTRHSIKQVTSSVKVSASAATHLSVTGAPLFSLAGTKQQVTVTALDAFGNRVLSGFADTITLTGPFASQTYTFGKNDKGAHNFMFTPTGPITTAITAADTNLQVHAGSETVTTVTSSVGLSPDPTDSSKQALIVIAPPTGASIVIMPVDASGKSLSVTVNGKAAAGGPFTPTGHLIVYAPSGKNSVRELAGVSSPVTVPGIFIAGGSTTTFSAVGSSAPNILVGGPGRDTLTGGTGPSLLIGGKGADSITAGSGGSIVIGGSTAYDANVAALVAILGEWTQQGLSYAQRLQAMSQGGTDAYLLDAHTVFADPPGNQVTGGSSTDWFWLTLNTKTADTLGGYRPGAVITLE